MAPTRTIRTLVLLASAVPAAAQISSYDHPVVILQEGDVPDGGGGLAAVRVNPAHRDAAGKIGCTGLLEGAVPDAFLWVDGEIRWRGSDEPAGYSWAARRFGFRTVSFTQAPLQFAVQTPDTLLSHDGPVMAEGEPAPFFPAGATIQDVRAVQMVNDGTIYWKVIVDMPSGPDNYALLKKSPASYGIQAVLLPGQKVGEGLTIDERFGVGEEYQVSGNGAHHAHTVYVDGLGPASARSALFVDGRVVLAWHDPVAGAPAGTRWERFTDAAINDQGDYLFTGVTDADNSEDDVLGYNGQVLVTEGDVLDGVWLTPYGYARETGIADDGRIAFVWLTGGFGPEHLFVGFETAISPASFLPRRVLSTGDPLDLDGNGTTDAHVGEFSPYGDTHLVFGNGQHIYVQVELNYVGGPTRLAIVRMPL